MVMLLMQLLSWWYGRGWKRSAMSVRKHLTGVSHLFSVPILLRTLWSPWRRIVSYPGASIDAKLRALGDNMVSRMIGFTVRLLVLFTAGISLLVTSLGGIMVIIAWPLVPVLIVGSLIMGVIR